MPKHRARQLGEETLDQIEPGRMDGCEGEGLTGPTAAPQANSWSRARHAPRLISIAVSAGVQEPEKLDEFATAMANARYAHRRAS